MVEIGNRWILQEIFVHPDIEDERISGVLNVEVFYDLKKEKGLRKVIVEIVGGIFEDGKQIANIRFVNVSKFKSNGRKSFPLKKVVNEKIKELLSFLPIYLVKSGIFVEGIKVEM